MRTQGQDFRRKTWGTQTWQSPQVNVEPRGDPQWRGKSRKTVKKCRETSQNVGFQHPYGGRLMPPVICWHQTTGVYNGGKRPLPSPLPEGEGRSQRSEHSEK